MPNQKQKERSKGMKDQINSQVLFNEQIEKFKIVVEKMGVERFRHALLLKLIEERNNSAFESIDFKRINELIEETYRELGYEG